MRLHARRTAPASAPLPHASGGEPAVVPPDPDAAGIVAPVAVTALALAPSADCKNFASVNWSFSYTVNPALETYRITSPSGPIGGQDQLPSFTLTGSFTGQFVAPILIPQSDGTIIGTYGAEGPFPPTVNTAEFFILYNCSTKQGLYQCSGNNGTCPRTAAQAMSLISTPVPVDSTIALVAATLLVGGLGAAVLRSAHANR